MNVVNNQGRRLIIPDIHGCYFTFSKLLEKIHLEKHDSLFLLGDYINRGSHNKKVIDLIMQLIGNGFNIFPLRGNHEQMLLDSESHFKKSRFVFPGIKKPADLYDEENNLISTYKDFIIRLPFFYELDKFLLVHAGFNTSITDPFKDTSGMIWSDSFEYDPIKLKKKIVVHGHTPKYIDEIISAISGKNMVIPLDNGVNEHHSKGQGNLVCLDIDSMQLFVQEKSSGDF
jgi:serine/threonine protein phosphatase 1